MRTSMEIYKNTQGEEVKKEKYNHLAMAEMSNDVNYTRIDGIMGNNKQMDSVEQKLKDAQERAKKHREKQNELRSEPTSVRQQRRHKEQRHNRDGRS